MDQQNPTPCPDDNQSTQASEPDATDALEQGEEGCNHYIVGVGASAGGLEALEKMFQNVPEDCGMSFVVVQHLSPDFKSHMDRLLARVTSIPVEVVTDGVVVEPNHIYLIPPKKEMVISNGRLLLTERSPQKILSHPIDQFFRALAQDAGRFAIGVVLSGTGSDGSRGVIDISENGGLAVSQEPETCRFDAMPINARDTGHVSMVLAPEAIGEALRLYAIEGEPVKDIDATQVEEIEKHGLTKIFDLLQKVHKIDFSNYKSTTVSRRVQRRIELGNYADIDTYLEDLAINGEELSHLYKDLLIGVTKFFRDAEAFTRLEKEILPDMLQHVIGETLRVWVCACATGEEAYSLAMILTEIVQASDRNDLDFKIFATDAHKDSLNVAAAGVYPASALEDLSPERRERYFVKRRDGYAVKEGLRRSIVFAPHNVISDPPFTQMHMVTCRNLLIYFRQPAQRKTLSLFHFALKMNGILFLGPSESPGEIGDEFDVIDSQWKIYRKRRDVRLPLEMRMPTSSQILSPVNVADSAPRTTRDTLSALYDRLLDEFMPPSVVVDHKFEIIHVFRGAEQFLRMPAGRPSTNLLDVIYPAVKTTLAGALQNVRKNSQPVRYTGIPHPVDDTKELMLHVKLLHVDARRADCLIVQFESQDTVEPEAGGEYSELNVNEASASRIESLEQELDQSRQNLQATIEELETSNEELQATNEEMVASNEELQSTNEELHSVNEELHTVNAENQRRVAELDEANADMANLLATTRAGVIFLDTELYIRRFTPETARIFFLEQHDVGRSIESFTGRVEDPDFIKRLRNVLKTRREEVWEVRVAGVAYLCRTLPYWTDSRIQGIVVSLVNVQEFVETKQDLARFKFMADQAIDAYLLIDASGRVTYCNNAMEKRSQYSQQELTGMAISQLDAEMDEDAVQHTLTEVKRKGGLLFESSLTRRDQSTFPVEVSLTPVDFDGESFAFASIRDITSRRLADAHRFLLENAIESVSNGIVITDPNQKDNPITFVNDGFLELTGYDRQEVIGKNCRFLQGERTAEEQLQSIREAIEAGKSCRELLLNYRKNGETFWNDLFITPVRNEQGRVIRFVGVQNDISDRMRIAEESQESERTIRLLLDSTAEGIFGVDVEGKCTFCNASALQMLGFTEESEVTGKPILDMLQPAASDGSKTILQSFTSCLKTGEQINQSGERFRHASGTSFPVEYWCHPVLANDEWNGAVITFVDISSRLQTEAELHEARDTAEMANQAKTRFLANMSHELRTPMSAIMGFTEILQKEIKDPNSLEHLAAIQRNGGYLLKLLNDLLDLSRIESGKLSLERSETDLETLLGDIHHLMQTRATDAETQLEFSYPEPLPVTIRTDQARLRQVLVNLIANAIKFAPGGNVQVTVTLKDAGKDSHLRFDVKDNGIGIEPDRVKMLFEPFTQADSSISKRFGGTGLGLSITKRLLEALKGEVSVESQPGVGSTFTVKLPVHPVNERVQMKPGARKSATAKAPENAPQEINARILIVDDLRDVRFVAEHFLKKAGCEVQVAENGQQALEAIETAGKSDRPFDLVLMDMQMPVMRGDEAVAELRRQGVDTPVIALTADAMKGARKRVLDLGFTDYLPKPIDSLKLIETVTRNLKA